MTHSKTQVPVAGPPSGGERKRLTSFPKRPVAPRTAADAVDAVHQFVPWLHAHDAVGSHSLKVREALRSSGFRSEIFYEGAAPEAAGEGLHFSEYPAHAARSVILYQMAVGSVLADYLFARPEPMILWYHNLTPGSFFAEWDPALVDATQWGRAQLAMLAPRVSLALAVSAYNESEMLELDYLATEVVPIFFSGNPVPAQSTSVGDVSRVGEVRGARWLFVGRIVPNKAQHKLIEAFYCYRNLYDGSATLTIVGKPSCDPYFEACSALIEELGLGESITIAQSVDDAELECLYNDSDLLVCVSEHEGFCVPLLEAMAHRLPIVALSRAAVPETLGNAGILLQSGAPLDVAKAADTVMKNPQLRNEMVKRGLERVAAYSIEDASRRLISAIAPVTGHLG